MTALLDVRTYKLTSGTCDAFDEMARERSLPMLERFGIRVLAHGPSADGDDHYYLIRAFESAAEREQQLEEFYGSDEWRQNHRDAFLALIDGYHTVAIELTPRVRAALTWAARAEEGRRR
jgi:hypothetical protein